MVVLFWKVGSCFLCPHSLVYGWKMSGIYFTPWGIWELVLCSSRARLQNRSFGNWSAVSSPAMFVCHWLDDLQLMSLVIWDGVTQSSVLTSPCQRGCARVSLFSRTTSLPWLTHTHWEACVSNLEIPGRKTFPHPWVWGSGAQSLRTKGLRWPVLQLPLSCHRPGAVGEYCTWVAGGWWWGGRNCGRSLLEGT